MNPLDLRQAIFDSAHAANQGEGNYVFRILPPDNEDESPNELTYLADVRTPDGMSVDWFCRWLKELDERSGDHQVFIGEFKASDGYSYLPITFKQQGDIPV